MSIKPPPLYAVVSLISSLHTRRSVGRATMKLRPSIFPFVVLAGLGAATATPASAQVCQYATGNPSRDLGPCMQFDNSAGDDYHLYCYRGPTSDTHRIIIDSGDSFTCRVPKDDPDCCNIANTNYNNVRRLWNYSCTPNQKQIVKLTGRGGAGTWSVECITLQPSLRW